VAPEAEDRAGLWREFVSHLRSEKYDLRIFEILPLYIKMAVIEEGQVLWSRDILELYEYFYPFRREWDDQKHRHDLSPGEMRELIAAARRARAGGRAAGPKGDRKVLVELSSFMWPSPKKGCMPKNAGVAKWLKAQGLGP
jgi:hypothetical protein